MCSNYPRTNIVYFNGMVEYQSIYKKMPGKPAEQISLAYADHCAKKIVAAMDDVCKTKPVLPKDDDKAKRLRDFKLVLGVD